MVKRRVVAHTLEHVLDVAECVTPLRLSDILHFVVELKRSAVSSQGPRLTLLTASKNFLRQLAKVVISRCSIAR